MGKRSKIKPPSLIKQKEKDEKGNPKRTYSNILRVEFNNEDFEDNFNSIDLSKSDIKYYIDKGWPMLPRAYQIIIETSNGKDVFTRANKMSAPDVAVTVKNINDDIKDAMGLYMDGWFEYLEKIDGETNDSSWVFDPESIEAVYVRFFYA